MIILKRKWLSKGKGNIIHTRSGNIHTAPLYFQESLLLSFLLSLFSLNSIITTLITPLKILCIALPLSFFHTGLAKSLASDNPNHLRVLCPHMRTCVVLQNHTVAQQASPSFQDHTPPEDTITGKSTESLVNSIHPSSEHLISTFPPLLTLYFSHPFPLLFCS